MRTGITVTVNAEERLALDALVENRNTAAKVVWRARIILATAAGCGTNEIVRRVNNTKTCLWRWQERYMRKIDRIVKKHLDVHLVLDNYATHKTPEVKAWLAKHPRFKLHFTPTSASWFNLVERFFAEITTKRMRRGTFTSVGDLIAAIRDYLDRHNAAPKPFRWHKTAAAILEKVRRALNKLDTIKTGCQALESEH
jgi:transposase